MGEQIIAICNCGLEKKLSFGGGLFTFREIEYFPAYCSECNDVVQYNLKSETLTCPICKSSKIRTYKDENLKGGLSKKIITSSFDNVLYDCSYKCPKCHEMSMRFYQTGLLFD
ncbi:hypothetical protein [Hanstruepera marina]|uniref:hypothetical protein n=1 Tax=Hanstruepera marina TaxID=2873265 RepID=UPI001CA60A82|nr:hypothetical protein [Hanstruepera marina]